MDCDHVRQQLEAYAVGALEADERAMVERHLTACPDCRRLAQDYADVVHSLPQALADAAAPAVPVEAMKPRLLQALDSPPASALPVNPQPAVRPPRRQRLWWNWGTASALVALFLLVFVLAWSIRLNVALAQERALRTEFANLVDQQEIVLEVVDSDQTSRAVLLPPGEGSRAYGKLFTRADLPHVVAMAARLPQPAAGEAYHFWVTTADGQANLAGTLRTNDDGFGLLIFDADRNGPTYNSAQLTLQPEGSTAPAGEPVLVWEATP